MKNKLLFFLFLLLTFSFSACKETVEKDNIEFEITPETLDFTAAGGEQVFKIYALAPATIESVESSASWCKVATSGTSPVNVTVTVAANEGEERTTTVEVTFRSGEKTISEPVQIIQKADEIEYTISPTRLDFPVAGGEDHFTVTVKSPAIIESIVSSSWWCEVTTNGTSPTNVTVKVNANSNDGKRNTTVAVNMKIGEIKKTATVQITQEGSWVLINDVKWATRNVDAQGTFTAKPEDAGMFYQWNRRVGWSSTDPMVNSNGGNTWDDTGAAGSTWASSKDPCPYGWSVPTVEELGSLVSAGYQEATLNGVEGCKFGSGNNSIFLPKAGLRAGEGTLCNVNEVGFYWSSTNKEENFSSYSIRIGSSLYTYARNLWGLSVRCVKD